MATKPRATIEDLYNVPDGYNAEIVNGELLLMPSAGYRPSRAAGTINISLRLYERTGAAGHAMGDGAGYVVKLPNRDSFSPDASFYLGPDTGGRLMEGAQVFAAEVRSEGDYGGHAESLMAGKRADYFAAGTLVVWDVDVLREELVRVYRAADPENPTIYRRGEVAEAEPALPGWRMPVDDLFA